MKTLKQILLASWNVARMRYAKRTGDKEMFTGAMGSFWQQFDEFEKESTEL